MLLISSDYPPPLEDSPGIREIEPSESLRGSKITGRGSPTCPTPEPEAYFYALERRFHETRPSKESRREDRAKSLEFISLPPWLANPPTIFKLLSSPASRRTRKRSQCYICISSQDVRPKVFSFGKEAVPVRHDKIKMREKEFARAPREKYDRLTQEVTFKKPHASCGFSPVYYIRCCV